MQINYEGRRIMCFICKPRHAPSVEGPSVAESVIGDVLWTPGLSEGIATHITAGVLARGVAGCPYLTWLVENERHSENGHSEYVFDPERFWLKDCASPPRWTALNTVKHMETRFRLGCAWPDIKMRRSPWCLHDVVSCATGK